MISSFTVSNFKAFGPAQTIPIKPITLIFGPNSAGKSSILHSLLFAHESLRTGSLDIRQTELGGQSVDLGGFQQLTHKNDPERSVVFSFRLPSLPEPYQIALDEVDVRLTLQLERSTPADFDALVDQFIFDRMESEQAASEQNLIEKLLTETAEGAAVKPVLLRFELSSKGAVILQASRRAKSGLRIDRFVSAHPAFSNFIKAFASSTTASEFSAQDTATVIKILDEILPSIELHPNGILCSVRLSISAGLEGIAPISKAARSDEIASQARLILPRLIASIFNSLRNGLRGFFDSLDYLGPLRCYPPRHVLLESFDDSIKSDGLSEWTALKDPAIREKVNRWLSSDFLSTKYALDINSFFPVHLVSEALETAFADIVNEKEAQYHEILGGNEETDEILQQPYSVWDTKLLHRRMMWWIIERCRHSQRRELTLRDRTTGASVSHRDIGIGISQLLPVLVKAYAGEGKTIAIEQPEIHLHPALQAELADVFIESALGAQKNTFLLETHSEHLILRILRRIRETADGTLPPEAIPIRPADVAILYVKPGKDGPQVCELPVNDEGDFDEPWPDGFFPERTKELF